MLEQQTDNRKQQKTKDTIIRMKKLNLFWAASKEIIKLYENTGNHKATVDKMAIIFKWKFSQNV